MAKRTTRTASKASKTKKKKKNKGGNPTKFNTEKKNTFLEVLMDGGTFSEAAKKIGVGRRTAYDWMEEHPEFANEVETANKIGCDVLEKEAYRRAVKGWEEPVFGSLGKDEGSGEIGTIRKYDGRLLIFLMSAKNPSKYRTNVKVEGNLTVTNLIDRVKAARERAMA